jgi:phosphoenolpyruvate-protein phosphotransferase/dihydroxyacetone kinase phosphotransfer subunit
VVGIVIVSHSRRLAEGAAELAREMGGPDVPLEIAGGLDLPDAPIGTDAVKVLEAIERAWSDDGVLVLMDLGSAVLSAEMALEMLPEDRRVKVLLSDAPLVEGAVAAAVTAKLGAPIEQVASEATNGLAGKSAHLGSQDQQEPSAQAASETVGPEIAVRLVVRNEHGLHARPAARFVQTASGFDADVRVANPATGRGPVSARSLTAVATLGIARGDEIEVLARGPQAAAALDAIRTLADRDFDETPTATVSVGSNGPTAASSRAPAGEENVIRGIATSPGTAVGPAQRFHVPSLEMPDRPARSPHDELEALQAALDAARADIDAQRTAVERMSGASDAAIFEAHQLLLHDDEMLEPVRRAITEQGRPAAQAWADEVEGVAADWAALEDVYLRARADDLRSVGRQVLAHLLGVPMPRPRLETAGILVAGDLTPADAAALDPDTVLGIATALGGAGSHAAVLARSLGIPAVVGLGEAILRLPEGAVLGVDGEAGLVIVEPDEDVADELRARRQIRQEADLAVRAVAREPAVTSDGRTIEVSANVGSPEDIASAIEAGCDGVGLFRTEFLFMQRDTMPTERDQETEYRRAAEHLGGRPMIMRTLDVGADKPLPYVQQAHEANPSLGVRGIRLGLERPELLSVQLRAILRVAADHPVSVRFPMITSLGELRAARAAVDAAREDLERERVRMPENLRVGVMIEVPAAALTARILAPEVDFFSIGTNDLTQYVMAADRGNGGVAALSDPLHPAVLRLIAATAEAAGDSGIWAGVCGELAGDPLATPLLLGLGIRELSMSARAIPAVKHAVRTTDLARARELANDALSLATGFDVRTLLKGEASGG